MRILGMGRSGLLGPISRMPWCCVWVSMTVSPLPLDDYAALCNCYKVRLLLAHLARPYKRISVDIFNGETLTEELLGEPPSRVPQHDLLPGCGRVAAAGRQA